MDEILTAISNRRSYTTAQLVQLYQAIESGSLDLSQCEQRGKLIPRLVGLLLQALTEKGLIHLIEQCQGDMPTQRALSQILYSHILGSIGRGETMSASDLDKVLAPMSVSPFLFNGLAVNLLSMIDVTLNEPSQAPLDGEDEYDPWEDEGEEVENSVAAYIRERYWLQLNGALLLYHHLSDLDDHPHWQPDDLEVEVERYSVYMSAAQMEQLTALLAETKASSIDSQVIQRWLLERV